MQLRLPTQNLRLGARRIADLPFVALLLSAAYPPIFLLSLNWYAFSTEKIVFILLTPVVAAVIAYLVVSLAVWALFAAFPALRGAGGHGNRKDTVARLLTGLVCSAILFFFLFGTLQSLLVTSTFLVLFFLGLTALLVLLAANRLLRYWTAVLSIMIVTSLVTWVHSAIAARFEAAAEDRSLIHSRLKAVSFKTKPNIYLIIYDGYGNKRLHHDVFGIDNSAIYGELAARNFKTVDTYSNYWSSWGSMLSLFLGEHHYYHVLVGAFDTKIGRAIMNGTRFNPTFSVLQDNGYKVQLIEPTNYLTTAQGRLDYHYPDLSEPVYIGLRVFNNPLLDRLPSSKIAQGAPNTLIGYVNDMTAVLLDRLQQTAKSRAPWFTYIHYPLPAHAGGPFRSLRSWEDVYREDTRKANAHMLVTTDKILSVDPNALIIIMGDHGSYRYSDAWLAADDPNEAFRMNELDSDIIAADYFGIMMAIRSRGQCDDMIYDTMTPVNLMRVIFSCLSGDRQLLDGRVEDISLFPGGVSRTVRLPTGLYMAVKDGTILKPWIKIQH